MAQFNRLHFCNTNKTSNLKSTYNNIKYQEGLSETTKQDQTLLDTPSPWNHCRLLTAQKSHTADWSEAFPIPSDGNRLSPNELRITIALRTGANIFESTERSVGSLLTGWGFVASPALRMRAASPDIQPETPSSNDH